MNSKGFWAMLVLGVCGLFLPYAAGQPPEKPKTDLGAPGEEHRKLDVLAGDWDVTIKFPVGPGKEMEGKSSCVMHNEGTISTDGKIITHADA